MSYVSIQAGNSREVASQAACAVYQQNYVRGVPLSAACLAAEVAWKNAVAGDRELLTLTSPVWSQLKPGEPPVTFRPLPTLLL